MEENKRGGKRERAGRKKSKNPKMAVTVYIPTNVVEKFGGVDGYRDVIYPLIQNPTASVSNNNPSVSVGDNVANEEDYSPSKTYNDYLTLIPRASSIEDCQSLSDEIERSDLAAWQKIALKKKCVERSQHSDLN